MTNQEIKDTGLLIKNEQQIGGNTALRVGGVIEGIGYALDNKDAANGYYQATINGGSISVNAPNYLLGTGGNLRLKMPSAGTTASTLSIGNATAVQLWYNGAAVSAQNTWEADEIISVFYDGTRFMASNAKIDNSILTVSGSPDSDLEISDENDNILAKFQNGEIKTKKFDSANTPQQKNATADLEFSDENDNVLVRFKNGHIKTKHFDSSSIEYKNLEGKKFSILGDSISTFQGYIPSGYAYFYPAGNLTNVADTWWQKMAQETKLTLLKNCSWSGSDMCGDSTSTTSAQAGCSTKRISDLADGGVSPDIVIVYIGINDFYHAGNITLGAWTPKNEIPAEGTINHFSEAYALCLHKIMLAYPNAEIYCCSLLECKTADTDNRYPVINSNNEYLIDFNNKIKEIADGLGVYFIDVHSCGINYWNGQGDTLLDSTHPNVKGAGLVSRCITNAILNLTKKYQ